jgi:glucose dehydrogenase
LWARRSCFEYRGAILADDHDAGAGADEGGGSDWITSGGALNQRYSTLDQINTTNVFS